MSKKIWGYIGRFTLLHVFTYFVIGLIIMELQNYEEAFATIKVFKLYRDLENPLVAASVIPMQILRGGLLAQLLYPFYNTYMKKKHGWLLLFGVLYGFTFTLLSAWLPGFLIDFVKTIITGASISKLLVGTLEITVQMLVFSWLFFNMERKRNKKASKLFKIISL